MRDDAEIDALVDSLRTEGFRGSGPRIIAAAEGYEGGVLSEAFRGGRQILALGGSEAPGAARAGRSAVLAMTTPSEITELSDLLRDDEVHAQGMRR